MVYILVTLQAAVHLGQDSMENSRFTKNQLLKSAAQLFQVTEKLIEDQREIHILTTTDYKELTWRSTSLLCDKAFEITNPVEAWKNNIKWYLENRYLEDLNRIHREPMDFRWKNLPGFTMLGLLEKIQKYA